MRETAWRCPGLWRHGRFRLLWVGAACAWALALEGVAFALPDHMSDKALIEALSSGSARDRAAACERLGDRRLAGAQPQIAQAAEKDRSARVRKECAEALGELGGSESAAVLRRIALSDTDEEVRIEALDGLEEMGTQTADAPAVAQILKSDASPRVREAAAELLGDRQWKAGIPALTEVVKDNRAPIEVRKECIEALFKMDDPDAYQVVYEVLLHSDSVRLRREAADVIEDRPPASALDPLCQALGDPDKEVAEDAVEGLLRLGNASAVPLLRAEARKRGGWLAKKMNAAADRLER